MPDLIHLLPDSVANQIAAGEVIQRPASVVKELVENAVDAGAISIDVLLTDAGRTCIQVIDDGKGMTETDARISFERHATSKIMAASDLFSLNTFGFRGEALPSIAAVAQVELHTRTQEDELGTCICIAGSKLISQSIEMCPVGCNFLVKNLFYNVPARRKFLKSDQTELSNVIAEVERIALVHPDIAFTLRNNGAELMNVPPANNRQRIMHLFGKKINQELLNIEVQTTIVDVTGFVGVPESARKKGCHQFFFVNGRYMRHPYFHKAILEAFSQLIPENEQVSYFIYFTVDPSRIDVNIHPTKTEIKFEDEHAIWQILVASVREVLGRTHAAPSIDFDTVDRPDIPFLPVNRNIAQPQVDVDPSYNPFKDHHESSYHKKSIDWEKLYGVTSGSLSREDSGQTLGTRRPVDAVAPDVCEAPSSEVLFPTQEDPLEQPYNCMQLNGRFIVASVGTGMMLIEQQRAHIRILFDRYMKQFDSHKGSAQGLLFPELFQTSPSEAVVMDSLLDDFACLGFDISNIGGGSYSIQGIPSDIAGIAPCKLVHDMLTGAMEKGNKIQSDVQQCLALTMARSSAVVIGQVLSNEEMCSLIGELFACSMPNYTPDGKKVLCMIEDHEIERLFE